MRRVLAHGGPLSFTREGWYAICRRTGRCQCLASTYHGVRSARGLCKHARLLHLELRAGEGDLERTCVRVEAFETLHRLVHAREARKPASIRCTALYDADTEVALLAALVLNKSVPPTGKSTGLDDVPPPVPPTGDRDRTPAQDILHATFQMCTDLGVRFIQPEATEDTLDVFAGELLLHSFMQRQGGQPGPASHTGDQLRPGDVVVGSDRG